MLFLFLPIFFKCRNEKGGALQERGHSCPPYSTGGLENPPALSVFIRELSIFKHRGVDRVLS